MSPANDPGRTLRATWARLNGLPGGRWLFSRMVGFMAPYTGTVGATVLELAPGHARIQMRDRRRVRNHLHSIHAVALLNLAEITTGLALMFGIPQGTRGILTGFSIEYLKKARGTLVASCDCDVPATTERQEYEVIGEIHDPAGVLVARATARWLLGPSTRP